MNSCGIKQIKKDAELNSAWHGSCHSELVSESNAMQSKWTMLRKWIDNSEKWKLETGFQDFAGFQDDDKIENRKKKINHSQTTCPDKVVGSPITLILRQLAPT